MTTLVNAYPYTHFLLGLIDPGDEDAVRAADASAATEAALSVTIGTVATVCKDYARAIGSFNDTEGGDSQTVTNLASRAAQNAPSPVPTWEAPCTMRVYLGADGSHELVRDHDGYWVMYAEHATAGPYGGRRGVQRDVAALCRERRAHRQLHPAERRPVPAQVGGLVSRFGIRPVSPR